jgi:hypothetical protein
LICPWHDPSLYALDGLELLLRSASSYDRNLTFSAESLRKKLIGALAKLVVLNGFFLEFAAPQAGAPKNAGEGVRKLRRMFVQRSVCVRWIARQMHRGPTAVALSEELGALLGLSSNELSASLVRAWLTDADGAGSALDIPANVGNRLEFTSPLRPLFLWLHEAIVLLGRVSAGKLDPLENIRGKLSEPLVSQSRSGGSQFFRLLNLWRPDLSEHELVMLELRLDALAALLAVCSVDGLIQCLSRRPHLLGELGVPLPALPGIPLTHLVLKNPDDKERNCLKAISQIFIAGQPPPKVDYRIATREISDSIQASWSELLVPIEKTRLAGRKALWEGTARQIRNMQPEKVQAIGYHELRWAADCFEALARVNHQLEFEGEGGDEGELMEFVPAWPFICASNWAEDHEIGDLTFSLFGPVVPRIHLANFAFARDGKGRLRTHEVPLADARLWRIGYAVTDALGLVDELERFQALEIEGASLNINIAQHVLSRLLGRLRGEGQPSTPGLPHPNQRHLTGSTHRALSLLRSFPTSGDSVEETQFLLAVETETAAMRLQVDGHNDISRPGILVSMMSKLAPAVFSRLTSKQLEALPEMAVVEGPTGTERRVVAAWRLLDRRLSTLESCLAQGVPEESQYAWTALRRSVRLSAVTAWIRALVFEMYLAGDGIPSIEVEVPSEWQLSDPALAVDTISINIGVTFRDALAPKGRLAIAATITPLGWLTLLTNQLNLYSMAGAKAVLPEVAAENMRPSMTLLAQQLATACPEDVLDDEKWPFDGCSHIAVTLDQGAFESALSLLADIQSALGYRVHSCKSHIWGLPPQSKSFMDESGRQWPVSRGLIDQVGRDRQVEIDAADDEKRVWTQTTNRDGKLIGVSVLGDTFAKTAGTQGRHFFFEGDTQVLTQVKTGAPDVNIEVSGSHQVEKAIDPNNAPFVDEEEELNAIGRDGQAPLAEAQAENSDKASSPKGIGAEGSPIVPENFFRAFRELQEKEWRTRRREKSPGHVRYAVFQFRIDDSYYHPIVDAGFPDAIDCVFCSQVDIDSVCGHILAEMAIERANGKSKNATISSANRARACLTKAGLENQWDTSELVPSWNEHRRRRLIDEAIRACHEFDVDVLVLPEYSVRPDTVEWMRDRLKSLSEAKLSIVAGTYRLHGTPRDLHFTESFKSVFGAADEQKVFSPKGRSMEKSSYITLLQPIQGDVPGAVAVFSRRKKFHSMAMGELINPSGEKWAPLGSLEGLVFAIEKARKEAGLPSLDVKKVVSIAQKIRPVDRMAELICSELFASTHPVNHETIRSEYNSLRKRFGNGESSVDHVISDIMNLTAAIRLDDRVDRRTILVVPACTTRSADYWIYGQSALLAAGLTTVFCAAVLTDPKTGLKGGGSCIIARSSWSSTRHRPGHLLNATPYSGWSRGIYYNRPEDVLTRKEQAIVIADIDPIYMNEGKPRPQALPVPVQLVAHLPIVEMLDQNKLQEAYSPDNGGFVSKAPPTTDEFKAATNIHDIGNVASSFGAVNAYLNSISAANLVDAKVRLANGKELTDEAKGMGIFFSEPSGWTARLEFWNRNWREMPFYGPPPTLIDWLPVDLSPVAGKLPTVLVPPWGGDFGETWPAMDDSDLSRSAPLGTPDAIE